MTNEAGAADRSPMRSLERALDVIDALAGSSQPMRLAEVSRATGLHIATTQRIVKVLEQRSYVSQDPAGYSIGPAALATAHSFILANQLSRVATPVLQELAAALGLTASLSVQVGTSRVLIARIEGTSPLRYQLPIGGRLPLHVGAGKVFLAYMSPEERESVLSVMGEVVLAHGGRISRADYEAELNEIAKRGYGLSRSERVLGAVSVSAPVKAADGALAAVLQVSGREEYLTPDRYETVVKEVRAAAAGVAARYR